MKWLQWIQAILSVLFGGSKSTAEDQQLADAQQTAREAQNAADISKQVDEAGVDRAADDLDGGVRPTPSSGER